MAASHNTCIICDTNNKLKLHAISSIGFKTIVGKIMDGSGLEKVWEEVYAPNSIPHMLAGKATARALRGYFLV